MIELISVEGHFCKSNTALPSSAFASTADMPAFASDVRKVPTTAIKQECFYFYDCTVIDRSVQID
jgi:hypothetical protein